MADFSRKITYDTTEVCKKSICFLICGKEFGQGPFLFWQKQVLLDKVIKDQGRIALSRTHLETPQPQKSAFCITMEHCTVQCMVQKIIRVEGENHSVMAYL